MTGLTRYHDLTQTSGDKVGTAYSYDGLSRLTAETTTRGTGTLTLAYSQTYNLASQIIALATEGATSNLTYANQP